MLFDMNFAEASDLYQDIKRMVPAMSDVFADSGMECIVDALHLYVTSGSAAECCNFDVDFAHLFTLAYREYTGHDLKPEYSCLSNWGGPNIASLGGACSNGNNDNT